MKLLLTLLLFPTLALAQTNLINFVSRPATTNEIEVGTNITRWITPKGLKDLKTNLTATITASQAASKSYVTLYRYTNAVDVTSVLSAPGTASQGTALATISYLPHSTNGTVSVSARVLMYLDEITGAAALFIGSSTNNVDVSTAKVGTSDANSVPVLLKGRVAFTSTNAIPVSVRVGPTTTGTVEVNPFTNGGSFTNAASYIEIVETP